MGTRLYEEDKNISLLQEIETRLLGLPAQCLVTILTELVQVPNGSNND